MTVCTRVSVAADDFLLPSVLAEWPAERAEIERSVPIGWTVMPYFWWSGDDTDRLRELLDRDPTVERVADLEPVDDGVVAGVTWTIDAPALLRSVDGPEVTCLRATGREDAWTLTLRFDTREALAVSSEQWRSFDLDVTVESINETMERPAGGSSPSLTRCQRETLRTALRSGYFDVPRAATLQDLGRELGVSDTAISQRLRRGLRSLVATNVG
ncbi:helix-turn-helix domain-containing protein [Halorubrum sp. Atlit-26R]|uniref:helix-turn-helix domain-containing protein n=1 Tax=Halorubrum sp. Atlit-26R TaxID=2282128 RepID=UPI000EF26B7B|nr:helix-turn-helix domain-containing protein [Halorubrum sp. Atlit-26R]RLM63025.1 hypothetical protein DVK07_17345 [Halorubrum sp. Atlit-26R]